MRCVDLVKDPQGQLLLRAFGGLRRLLFSLFHRRATWSVGRPGAAFSTPMSVALQRRLPRRRPPCPCCKFTSSTAIPRLFSSTACPLVLGSPHITEFYMIFIIKLLHPAPLMNSPSSSTCSHLLLVTSSHLDFPGGVMNRLSSPVGVLAP